MKVFTITLLLLVFFLMGGCTSKTYDVYPVEGTLRRNLDFNVNQITGNKEYIYNFDYSEKILTVYDDKECIGKGDECEIVKYSWNLTSLEEHVGENDWNDEYPFVKSVILSSSPFQPEAYINFYYTSDDDKFQFDEIQYINLSLNHFEIKVSTRLDFRESN